ncbi:glycoside hydrolase family 127 protein [bacterium]|nr:glycoside hydrolase family 127 protein [bacterium]
MTHVFPSRYQQRFRVQADASLNLYKHYLDRKREWFNCGGEPNYCVGRKNGKEGEAMPKQEREWTMPTPIDLSDVVMRGELSFRGIKNYARLEGKWYRPHEVFKADQHGWPGDWEGRIILALVSQAQATHREPAWLEEIIRRLPDHLNEKGYFGRICEVGWANEQQLSGHSWLLRGLIAYCEWKKDRTVRDILEGILRNLFLPAHDNFHFYPLTPEGRDNPEKWELSHLQSKTKTHKATSDTGCAFIALDGVTEAWRYLKWPELEAMARTMIDRFTKLQLEECFVQTHATLSCLRGICRYVENGGDRKYLAMARRIFDRYMSHATTEHYGNYNWWGMPRWTEPCAIIDSYILAHWFWRLTGETRYQTAAHHIFYNGLAHAFRVDGSFGTDMCIGAELPEMDGGAAAYDPTLLKPRTYEVYWCCTMRGGEFFARAAEGAFLSHGDDIWLPIFHNATAKVAGLTLRETTTYPYEGAVRLEVLGARHAERRTIHFFLPPWTSAPEVRLNGERIKHRKAKGFVEVTGDFRKGDVLDYGFDLGLHVMPTQGKNNIANHHSFRHGPLLLVLDQPRPESFDPPRTPEPAMTKALPADTEFEPLGSARYRVKDGPLMLVPVYDNDNLTERWHARQALFRD